MLKNTQSLGIVVELENIEISGSNRMITNLGLFKEQLSQISDRLSEPAQFKIVFDSNLFSQDDADRFMAETGLLDSPWINYQSIGAPGIHYYQHKNIGAAHCDTDIVLFMDSDILIEDGWLRNMLAPFDDDSIDFVSGRSFIETPRLLDKIYALTIPGFPLQAPDEQGLAQNNRIKANSFAFRPSKVEGDLFPQIRAYRGHCGVASQRLVQEGKRLYLQSSAVARHPSIEGLTAYFARAYAEGCDAIMHARYSKKSGFKGFADRSLIGTAYRLGLGVRGMIGRSFQKHRSVSLPVAALPLAIGCGTLYFLTRSAGEILTLISDRAALQLSIAKL